MENNTPETVESILKKGDKNIEYNSNLTLTPEYIEINYNAQTKKFKQTPRVLTATKAEPLMKEKQYNQMKQEIIKLKKEQHDLRKQHQKELNQEKLLTEKRIISILKLKFDHEGDQGFKRHLLEAQEKLNAQIQKNDQYLLLNTSLQEKVQELSRQNSVLKEQVERYRKMEDSLFQQNNENHEKSYNSEFQMGKESKKQDKIIKNLISQKQLLKVQLSRERQANYKRKSNLTDEERKEFEKTKKNLDKKSLQLHNAYLELDKQRVQNVQLTHSNKTSSKTLQNLKLDHETLKKIIQSNFTTQSALNSVLHSKDNVSENSLANQARIPKLFISKYEGQGVQGLAYYQNLHKQFKVRFRRACLRQKQLLYKQNSLQIGVITGFTQPNLINIRVHLTNYGNKALHNLKVKVINGNQNIIKYDINTIQQINPNEQIKIPISITLSYFPIGPVIFLLSTSQNEKEDLRVLLPVHIFKTMEIEARKDDIKHHSQVHTVSLQKKIAKDIIDLQQYFPKSEIKNKMMKLSLFHKQSHTYFVVDLIEEKDIIKIDYEHLEGNEDLTVYFVKTLAFLLSK